MCTFPSWIKDKEGKDYWLTDKDLTGAGLSFEDGVGHHAIEKVRGVKGEHLEGPEGIPEGFKSDIRSGKCNRMALEDLVGSIQIIDLLPEGLFDKFKVADGLYLTYYTIRGTKTLKSLPEDLKVEGNLSLKGCTSLQSVPKGLEVKGDMALLDCPALKSLPEGLKVGGNLTISNCSSLQSIPEGLEVRASLLIHDCASLESLSRKLKVEGVLSIKNCPSLPKVRVVPPYLRIYNFSEPCSCGTAPSSLYLKDVNLGIIT
jgi:hypothetical protein